MRRPAFLTSLLLACGILIAYYFDPPILLLLISIVPLLCVSAATLILKRSKNLPVRAVFLLMLFIAGALHYETKTTLFPPNHISKFPHFGKPILLEGQIADEPDVYIGKTKVTVDVRRIQYGGKPIQACGKVLLTLKGNLARLDYGDRIVVEGVLRRPPPARNPGDFDYRRYLLRRGIFGLMSLYRENQILKVEEGEGSFLISHIILPIKNSIRRTIERNLLGAPRALLKGVLLGEKRALPKDVLGAFSTAGVIHVLAVSGLHVGLVALFFLFVFKLLSPDKWATGATILALAIYALVTDLRPSVVRASIMAAVILIALAIERDSDIINTIGLAALIILIAWPQSLFELSFQLSFAATLSIVTLYRPILSLLPRVLKRGEGWWGKWIFSPLSISLAAQLGTAPIVALHFNRLPIISVMANIIVVPMIGVVLAFGILAAAFGFWLTYIATAFNAVNWLFLHTLIEIVGFLADVPRASLAVPTPSMFLLLGYFSLLVLIVIARRYMWAKKVFLFWLLVLTNIYIWRGILEGTERLEVTFLDVGYGDSVFVKFPNGRTMLVDGGTRTRSFDAGEWVLAPFFRHRGVKRLDVVVVTHPHIDHIGGLVSVLENFKVGHILESGQGHKSWTWNHLQELIESKGITHHRVATGDSLVGLGGVGAFVLHPADDFISEEGEPPYGLNNSSVVLKLDYGDVSFLLTGDVGQKADNALLCWRGRLRSTVLKVPHHGAGDSSSPDLLAGVDPKVAVISTGSNRFGYPSPEVIEGYEDKGVHVYRTDESGAVIITVVEKKLRIETVLEKRRETKSERRKMR